MWLSCVCEEATALRPNERFGMANLIANLERSRRSLATALMKRRNQI